MFKVVINRCYGGYDFSNTALQWVRDHYNDYPLTSYQISKITSKDGLTWLRDAIVFPRHCKLIVDCVEALGKEASSGFSELTVVEIQGDRYKIHEYDGFETITTPEDRDWIVIE